MRTREKLLLPLTRDRSVQRAGSCRPSRCLDLSGKRDHDGGTAFSPFSAAVLLVVVTLLLDVIVVSSALWGTFKGTTGSFGNHATSASDWVARTAGAPAVQKIEGARPVSVRAVGAYPDDVTARRSNRAGNPVTATRRDSVRRCDEGVLRFDPVAGTVPDRCATQRPGSTNGSSRSTDTPEPTSSSAPSTMPWWSVQITCGAVSASA